MRGAVLALILGAGVAGLAAAEPLPTVHVDNIFPTFISPHGGDVVTITGRNFKNSMRVFFDEKEAFVVAQTPATIQLITPPFDLGSDQSRVVKVTLRTSDGTFAAGYLTVVSDNPEPHVKVLAPQSGRLDGGTRVTIFGDGFQAPVQVFFDDVEARVVIVTLNQIVVIAPPATAVHSAAINITNVNAGKSATVPNAYRYVVPMTLNDVVPDHGPFGTQIAIHGTGFFAPVAVTIGGKPAAVIRVSDSEIRALTSPNAPACGDEVATISVANIDTGDEVSGLTYTYVARQPAFASLPKLVAGTTVSIRIANEANAVGKLAIGGFETYMQGSGDGTFTLRIPAKLVSCDGPSLKTTLTFTDLSTGCATTEPVVVEVSRDCEPRPGRRGAQ